MDPLMSGGREWVWGLEEEDSVPVVAIEGSVVGEMMSMTFGGAQHHLSLLHQSHGQRLVFPRNPQATASCPCHPLLFPLTPGDLGRGATIGPTSPQFRSQPQLAHGLNTLRGLLLGPSPHLHYQRAPQLHLPDPGQGRAPLLSGTLHPP